MNNKNAIILSDQLATWQACNVSAFLGSGVDNDNKGSVYHDQNGNYYVPLANDPMMIYSADDAKMQRTLNRANNRDVHVGIFSFEMFNTFNDADNRKVIADKTTDQLKLAGLLVNGDKKEVDKVVRGLHFYK